MYEKILMVIKIFDMPTKNFLQTSSPLHIHAQAPEPVSHRVYTCSSPPKNLCSEPSSDSGPGSLFSIKCFDINMYF